MKTSFPYSTGECILIFAKDKNTAGDYKTNATKVLEEELKLKVKEGKPNSKRV